jgi:Zn-dependent M28 family amino/carboxypeptidase
MLSAQSLILALYLAGGFSGQSAFDFTAKAVSFGPRSPGSPASRKLTAWLAATLKSFGYEVIEDRFTARTPRGPVPMINIVGRKRGKPGARALAISGHHDTKVFPFPFVGANDAGSSTGAVLELARCLKDTPTSKDIYFIFHDGEEAFAEWSATDSLYGSRNLSTLWKKDGTLARLDALINLDMIGDMDLQILEEQYSSEVLRRLLWNVAGEKGYSRHFSGGLSAVEDDHVPYLRLGVRALNLIDFSYGPNNAWWHTPNDTMEKVSAQSLQVVGSVVAETILRLDRQ